LRRRTWGLASLSGAAWLLTPAFNRLIGSDRTSSFSLPLIYSLGFAVLFLAGAFVSGAYPAFVLSGYHPITVLKGLFKNSARGLVLRKSLIVGQFAISVILIAGTILVYQQVQYMRRQQLGVNIEQTLIVNGAASIQQDSVYNTVFQPFKTTLLQQRLRMRRRNARQRQRQLSSVLNHDRKRRDAARMF